MSRLQIRLFGPYFNSLLVHSYGYEPANELKSVLEHPNFRSGPDRPTASQDFLKTHDDRPWLSPQYSAADSMIALMKGELAYKSVDHVILDVGGVGYRLFIPLSTFYSLPDSGPIQLFVHTHVREDALHLYGFLSTDEKQLFALLISISGIGPKLAINILSHIPAADLQTAIAEGDVKRLSALPGIGKKTAERLVLELQDKINKACSAQQPGGPSAALPGRKAQPLDDVVSALVNLGYKENQARKILGNMDIAPDTPMEDILKGALKVLVR